MNSVRNSDISPSNIYSKLVELIDAGQELAAAVVLSSRGSTPQVTGARAIMEASGRLWGTIGGGALEAKTQQAAAEVCRTQRPRVSDFPLTNCDTGDEAAICGGQMRVLLDPTVARYRSCFERAAAAVADRRRGCLLTTIRMDSETALVVPPLGGSLAVAVEWLDEERLGEESPGGLDPSVGEKIRSSLKSGLTEHLVVNQPVPAVEMLIEPVVPQPLLVIAGAGHVGRAVALLACRAGFDVTVVDDRPELAAAELFPSEVRVKCGAVPELVAACPLDAESYVVLATRNHRHDSAALALCIRRPLAYLGMIGSRRKVTLIRKTFLESGLATEAEFDRVHAPIGLEIGAVTVPEIAVSIVAQLIAARRQGACL
jgi:xanthine dehydrogenase accessory factor